MVRPKAFGSLVGAAVLAVHGAVASGPCLSAWMGPFVGFEIDGAYGTYGSEFTGR